MITMELNKITEVASVLTEAVGGPIHHATRVDVESGEEKKTLQKPSCRILCFKSCLLTIILILLVVHLSSTTIQNLTNNDNESFWNVVNATIIALVHSTHKCDV